MISEVKKETKKKKKNIDLITMEIVVVCLGIAFFSARDPSINPKNFLTFSFNCFATLV